MSLEVRSTAVLNLPPKSIRGCPSLSCSRKGPFLPVYFVDVHCLYETVTVQADNGKPVVTDGHRPSI